MKTGSAGLHSDRMAQGVEDSQSFLERGQTCKRRLRPGSGASVRGRATDPGSMGVFPSKGGCEEALG